MNTKPHLTGKTVVVIGGTSGFGYAVAKEATRHGTRLVIVGRDAKKAERAAAKLQDQSAPVTGYGCDASAAQELKAFFDRTGGFDHLVSTLGGAMGGGFLDAPMETIRSAIDEKFFANLQLARRAAPYCKDGGSMTFTAGAGGRPDNASGAIVGNEAISTLVHGLAVELAPTVRVNAVAPTWTVTPLQYSRTAEKRTRLGITPCLCIGSEKQAVCNHECIAQRRRRGPMSGPFERCPGRYAIPLFSRRLIFSCPWPATPFQRIRH